MMEFVCDCGVHCSNTFVFEGKDDFPYWSEGAKDAAAAGWIFRRFKSKIHPGDRKHLTACPDHAEHLRSYSPTEIEEEMIEDADVG